ncbi:MAG: dienelactone hydrolase family protein, partial [Chitinophagaceae bacterium]|nr:dienelactone hydrolase family protein [Chitinophagaceae bacterium]
NKQLPLGMGYYAWNGNSWDVVLSTGNIFVKGKNLYTTIVDSVEREYWVHVPSSYDSAIATPVVFMLHGTGGNGEKFYDHSGWKELGEEENFISVFPSSMRYRIFDLEDNKEKNTAKWNTKPDASGWVFMPGVTGKDDVKFLRQIITELKSKLRIDTSRIYLNGFSNGGSMAAKCAVEMGDVLAAVAHNAASFQKDTVYVPVRKIPILFQVGNKDYGPGVAGGPEIPLIYFDSLISTPGVPILNGKHYRIGRRHIMHFGLDSNYVLTGNPDSVMVASYQSLTQGDTLNVFKYVFVKELAHLYPNGENHWFDAPRAHWAWLRLYRRP